MIAGDVVTADLLDAETLPPRSRGIGRSGCRVVIVGETARFAGASGLPEPAA
jgi:hypothetical protein